MQLALGDLGVLLPPWLHALKPADSYGSPRLQSSCHLICFSEGLYKTRDL